MQKDLYNYDKMGLDKETLRKISIILQGTSKGPGISSKLLNFPNTEEIKKFIITTNRYFEGILQIVETEDKIVPIIINPDAYESKRRAISNKAIALVCIILLHEFEYSQGPTFDLLEQKLQSTSISANELRGILRELRHNRWIIEIKRENIIIYHPTTVLKACISPEMLKRILREIDEEYTDINLEPYLPKDYLELRKILKPTTRQLSVMDVIQQKKEEEPNNG
ncbi:MAG: hypothetical protein CEE43_01760 [Promethearchaeota archaeon Loki_b32]|nr:MAG: hypothetical protein CEE43_01760 [Candidatus Lokiarchaeota archaeon Loki_b32]